MFWHSRLYGTITFACFRQFVSLALRLVSHFNRAHLRILARKAGARLWHILDAPCDGFRSRLGRAHFLFITSSVTIVHAGIASGAAALDDATRRRARTSAFHRRSGIQTHGLKTSLHALRVQLALRVHLARNHRVVVSSSLLASMFSHEFVTTRAHFTKKRLFVVI